MQSILLRKEKWYHSDYGVYQNNEKVGEFYNETFKKSYTLNLKGMEYSIRKGNIWRNEKFLFQGNVQFAEIIEKPFKDIVILSFANGQELTVKHNTWKSIYTLFSGDKALGELKSKSFRNEIRVSDDLPHQVLAAFILSTMMRQLAYVALIALIPVYIVIFT